MKLAGRWVSRYRAIEQYGPVIDVLVAPKRDLAATQRFGIGALDHARCPTQLSTERAAADPRMIEELFPAGCQVSEQDATNPVEADHGCLATQLRRCAA